MARATITHITDDLDGSKDAEQVTFAFEGNRYQIDLSKKNKNALQKALQPYIQAATKAGRQPAPRRRATAPRKDLTGIRQWAKEQGLEVSDRGWISKAVIEQFDAAP